MRLGTDDKYKGDVLSQSVSAQNYFLSFFIIRRVFMVSSTAIAGSWLVALLLINRYVHPFSNWTFYPLLFLGLSARRIYYWRIYPFHVSKLRNLAQIDYPLHPLWGHFHGEAMERSDGTALLDRVELLPEGTQLMRVLGLLNTERVMLVSLQALQDVLQTQCYEFPKPPYITKQLQGVLGNGLLFAEGEAHKRQRKLLMPAFSYGRIKSLVPVFLQEANRLSNVLESKLSASESKIGMSPLVSRLTLDIIYRTGLGTQFDALENPDNKLALAYDTIFSPRGKTSKIFFLLAMLVPMFYRLPFKRNVVLRQSRETMNKFATDAIEKKIEKFRESEKNDVKYESKDVDLISIMIEEGPKEWGVQDMADQLLTCTSCFFGICLLSHISD